jgi:2-polyprenyl-3-methyl-5-hydroxy-6-metoxy-1,4-benzoquinol methylase
VTEHRLYADKIPVVSTAEYHRDRSRAPHLEQEGHRDRLHRARDFIATLADGRALTVSDLGCGDGGLLSLVQELPGVTAWGYDFQPSNADGWRERGVTAYLADVFNGDRSRVRLGDVVVMTEVLEHLADPHGVLAWVRESAGHLVCSSPWNEGPHLHDECHAWTWDVEGYALMIERAGWTVVRHDQVGPFQVVLAH